MRDLALAALERLFNAANRRDAGVSSRAPALTRSGLAGYSASPSIHDKECFEAVLLHAQAEGAVRLEPARRGDTDFITRVELVNMDRLAAVLGRRTHAAIVDEAREVLANWLQEMPVLVDVLDRWSAIKNVRGGGPEAARDWADACCTVAHCRALAEIQEGEIPVRDASARLFQDTKRIEALTPQLDVLLQGDTGAEPRRPGEVLHELGLFREPQPARLSGKLVVRRERGAFTLDRPYCALPPSTILSVESVPSHVLTIENLTTFHVQARLLCDRDVLCIYTGGMPSPAWTAMYGRILVSLPSSVPIFHWGDIDEGGFRIAAFLSRVAADAGRTLKPWNMCPSDVPQSQHRPALPLTLNRMVKFARDAGWPDLAGEIEQAGIVAEQEG